MPERSRAQAWSRVLAAPPPTCADPQGAGLPHPLNPTSALSTPCSTVMHAPADPQEAAPSFYHFLRDWVFAGDEIGLEEFVTEFFIKRGAPASPMEVGGAGPLFVWSDLV